MLGPGFSGTYQQGVIKNVRVDGRVVLNQARFITLEIDGYLLTYTGTVVKQTTLDLRKYAGSVITIDEIESNSAEEVF